MDTSQEQLLKEIAIFLEANNIPYMITGAWSAIFYGRPRASHDIDFVVELHKRDLNKIVNIFDKLPEDFLIQANNILEAVNKKSMFQVLHLPTMLKMDFWMLTDTDFDRSRFKRRKKVKILGQDMEMATAEDTIIQKLIWYKMGGIEKHLIDASFVFQIQRKNLDFKYLDLWIKKLGLKKYYQSLDKIDLEDYL